MEVLFNGLRRLEYRGYDSAGVSIDSAVNVESDVSHPPLVFRQEGNIESLVKSVYQGPYLKHSRESACVCVYSVCSKIDFIMIMDAIQITLGEVYEILGL